VIWHGLERENSPAAQQREFEHVSWVILQLSNIYFMTKLEKNSAPISLHV